MTASPVLLCLVGELLRLFGGLLDLPAQDDIGLNGLSQIQVPNLNIWQEGGDDGVVALGGSAAVDGT